MSVGHRILVLALCGLTASVYAQHPAPPSPAAMLLRHREELRLTAAQIKQLEALDKSYVRDARPTEERLLETRASERRLRAKQGELTEEERMQLSVARAELRKDLQRLRSIRQTNREEAWKVLTTDQRARAEQLLRERLRERRDKREPGKKPAGTGERTSGLEYWLR